MQYRELSNFYQGKSFKFHLPIDRYDQGFPAVVWVESAEKAIMLTKAALMRELATFVNIRAAGTPHECKALGRKVTPWDEALWKSMVAEVNLFNGLAEV